MTAHRSVAAWRTEGMVARTDGSQICQVDPEMFFSTDGQKVRQAALACAGCRFQISCRIEGLQNQEEGVWGGLSFNMRARMGAKGREAELARLRALLATDGINERSA